MELQQKLTINNTPAVVELNFKELKEALAVELKKYDIVVTVDTVADAKKLATELNATKNTINERRKKEVAKASEPVKLFDEKMKSLVGMCSDGRKKILDQVEKFEDETRGTVKELLAKCRIFLFDKHGVVEEFYRAEFDDLVKVSALTAGGKLTKSVKDELQNRVLIDKSVQDKVERRLLELENQSLKAGLTSPLNRHHVEHFLLWDDDGYQREVNRIIGVEVQRQEHTEKAALLKKKREDNLAEEVSSSQSEPEPEPKPEPEQEPEPEPEPRQVNPGRSRRTIPYEVSCVFNVNVPAGITEVAIDAEIRKVLKKAGISTLSSVYVKPVKLKP